MQKYFHVSEPQEHPPCSSLPLPTSCLFTVHLYSTSHCPGWSASWPQPHHSRGGCRSRTQDWAGSFFWDLPDPLAITHPLSTTAHVCWMKISAPRAVYSTENNPHLPPGQLWHQDIVILQPIHCYIQPPFPVACFQGFVFLIFLPKTLHYQGTIITIIIYYSDCSSSAHSELSLLLPSSHLPYKVLHRNTDKK